MNWYLLVVAHPGLIDAQDDKVAFRAEAGLQEQGFRTWVPFEIRAKNVRAKNNQPVTMPFKAPIMPGYVFVGCKGDISEDKCRRVPHVIGIVRFDGVPARLTEMEFLKARARIRNRPAPSRGLKAGDAIRVTDGPFSMFPGILESIGKTGIEVTVHIFGRSTRVKLSPGQVEKAA